MSSAATIMIGDGGTGTATIVTGFNAQTNAFVFTATNTSAINFPGSTSTITAFGVDLPPLGNASPSGLNGFSGSQLPSVFASFTFSDAALGPVPGGGVMVLDFGFLTGAAFAAGNTNLGLLPGESASFTVSGAAFAGFTEEQISTAITARFERASSPVPAPATLVLTVVGLAGVATSRRRSATVSRSSGNVEP